MKQLNKSLDKRTINKWSFYLCHSLMTRFKLDDKGKSLNVFQICSGGNGKKVKLYKVLIV
ncbi:hypothetical protein HMPREF3291_08485 [Bacillus sp. HMSC76G11]|nr:hypothetical protein HMPREF3291_08485 [Bacillus sp. HMSC76G11]